MIQILASGRVGQDAELNGDILKFSIASSERAYKTKDGKEIPEKTTWLNCTKFKGALLAPHIKKGTFLVVNGKLEIREYEGKYYTSCIVTSLEFGGSAQGNTAPADNPF